MDFMEIEGIKIQLEKKRVKNFNLTVKAPYGEVKLSYPTRLKKQDCYHFVQTRLTWIKRQQKKFKCADIPKQLVYEPGEKVWFMGKENRLNIKIASTRFVEIKNRQMYLSVFETDGKKEKEQLILAFYRKELSKVLSLLVKKWEPIMQVNVYETKIKNMKTLWGSCNINAHRIWFNLQLAKYDIDCIEYVVVHEMVHLLERLHSQKFYQLMDSFLPGWHHRQALLNQKNE